MPRLLPPGAITYPYEVRTPTQEWLNAVNSLRQSWADGALVSASPNARDFAVVGGSGSAIVAHGMNFTFVGLLGSNTPDISATAPIGRYSYMQFSADSAWRLAAVSNHSHLYLQLPFEVTVLTGRGDPTFSPANRWLFGVGDTIGTGSPDPESTQDTFFGFVNKDTETNMRLIVRAGGATITNINTGISRGDIDNGAFLTVSHDGNGNTKFIIATVDYNKKRTIVYNTTLSGLSFGPLNVLFPYIQGSASTGTNPRQAVVAFYGYYNIF